MRRSRLHAELIDGYFRPGESLIEFLVRRLDAHVFRAEFLKMLLRIAVELLKIDVERLQPASQMRTW